MRTQYVVVSLPSWIDFTTQHDRDRLLECEQNARLKLRKLGISPPELGFKVRTVQEVWT